MWFAHLHSTKEVPYGLFTLHVQLDFTIGQDNIRLRSANLDDSNILNQWWNDGAVMDHAGFPNGLGQSLEETKESILRFSSPSELMMIEIDGVLVGGANYEIKGNIAYPGWKICDSSYQNKGYGTQVIKMIFHHLFSCENLKIEKIKWDTLLENDRAQHIYEEKLKARKINVIENAFVDQLGRKRTAVEYELCKEEFYSYY
mgnify:CR=1 FL=1